MAWMVQITEDIILGFDDTYIQMLQTPPKIVRNYRQRRQIHVSNKECVDAKKWLGTYFTNLVILCLR